MLAPVFDENVGGRAAPTPGKHKNKLSHKLGGGPPSKLKTPFAAKTPFGNSGATTQQRRALGDISNRSAAGRIAAPGPHTATKPLGGGVRLFQDPVGAKPRPKPSARKPKPKKSGVEDIEVAAGRLGGDASPPPLTVDLGFDLRGLKAAALAEEDEREEELSPGAAVAALPPLEPEGLLDQGAVDLEILGNLESVIDDLDCAMPDDLMI